MSRKNIFFIIAILFATGILIQIEFNISKTIIAIVLTFLIVCSSIFLINKKRSTGLMFCALLICIAGMVRICIFDIQSSNDAYQLIGNDVTLRGTIAESPILYAKEAGSVYLLKLDELVHQNGKKEKVSGYLRVYDDYYAFFYEPGDYIETTGTVKSFNEFKNPGKAEYKNVNKGKHIIGILLPKKGSSVIEKTNSYYIERICKKIKDKIENTFSKYVTDKNLPILMSLLFGGNYNNISPKEIEAFSTTGIIHILSVSGSHITLLFGFIYMLGKWFQLKEKSILILTTAAIFIYAAISGFSPPVIRSSIMGFLAIVAIFSEREKQALNVLGATVFIMLIVNPYYISDISFQLSVGASAGILIFYKPIEIKLGKIISYKRITQAAALSISAQLLIVPIILYNFHNFPIYFIFSNIFVTPLLDFVIILGLTAAIFVWILPPLSGGILYITDYILEFSLIINHFIANLPKARYLTGGMNLSEVLTYYGAILFVYVNKKIRKEKIMYVGSISLLSLLIITTIYLKITEEKEYVIIPDTGKTVSAGIISKNEKILYYEYKGNRFSGKEFKSVLEYYGIGETDILILNINGTENINTIPDIPAKKILIIGKDKNQLINQLQKKGYFVENAQNKTIKYKQDLNIHVNNEDCIIERKDNAIYFMHGNFSNTLKTKKGILFIECNEKIRKRNEIKQNDFEVFFSKSDKKRKNEGNEINVSDTGMIKLNYKDKWTLAN